MTWKAHPPRSRAWHLVAIALLAAALALEAVAQPKPALVKGIDDPGRDPYQESVTTVIDAVSCGAQFKTCVATFQPVPAGKRLVVTHATAFIPLTASPPQTARAVLRVPTIFLWLPVLQPTGPGSPVFISSSPVTFYAEAGISPTMHIEVSQGVDGTGQFIATIAGYYLTVP